MGMSGGSHTRVHSWAADLAANIKITASRFDAENDDFSSSLSVMIARDGQSTITANIPFSNFKPTGVTAASALDQFTTYADVNTGRPNFITVVETTADNSISGVGAIAITAYTTGQPVFWIPGFNNTGGATLTISGLSAASVLAGGAALTSGMLLSGVPAMVVSDGSGWHCMNPQRAPANFNVVGSYQASSIATADVQDNAFTLAKLNHESTQGAVITMGASGTPQYLTATTSGLPLVTKGASVDAAFQQIGVAGIADNSITLAKWNHETVQGAIVYTDASGTPSYLAPGTSGQFLQSGGASANPSWAAAGDLLAANNLSDVTTATAAFINIKQDASATATGVVELSTDAELATGTDTSRAVTPANIESLIIGKTEVVVAAADSILLEDATDSTLKRDTVQGILDLVPSGGISQFCGVSTHDLSTASGSKAITGVGFTPKAVWLFGGADNSAGATSWGFATTDDQQRISDRHDANPDTFHSDDQGKIAQYRSGASQYGFVLASFDSDGFTLTTTKIGSPTGTFNIQFLCIG